MSYRATGNPRSWVRRRPFVGAYDKGREDASNGEPNQSTTRYNNRGWGHQFQTAYDYGYRDQLRKMAEQRRLPLEDEG